VAGPNGAGKTKLLEAIAGLLPVDSGEIRPGDQLFATVLARKAMFYLPDGVRPYADQTAEQVLAFLERLPALGERRIRDRVNRRSPTCLGQA